MSTAQRAPSFTPDRWDRLPAEAFALAMQQGQPQLALACILRQLQEMEEQLDEVFAAVKVPPNRKTRLQQALTVTQGQLRVLKSAMPDPTIPSLP